MKTGELWWVQAIAVAVFTSIFLNGASFLPVLRDIKPRRIEARWVGYVGLSFAFGSWLVLGPQRPAWQAVAAWIIIMLGTLIPNTLIHWRDRDTKDIRLLLTKEGEMLLQRWLGEHAPDDPSLRRQFMEEQAGESAEERWIDAMAPWITMLSEFDVILACLMQAIRQEPKRKRWLLTVIADLVEIREQVCKAKANAQIWYRIFWPEYAA